nr:acyl-CoA thioesterase [Cytophagales bacterium]
MAAHYSIQRRVEFSETDMAGIMHFSNFFRFMEAAEHAFLRSIGYSVVMNMVDPPVGWPRVHCECDFKKPVRFEEVVEVHLKVSSLSSRTITYVFELNLLQDPDSPVAHGKVIAACVSRDPESGQMKSIPIPESFKKAISALLEANP